MFDRTQFLAILAGAAGGAIAIASMEAFSATAAFPLVAIPFATSIVTVLGSPKAEPAQPRALIGGHLVSTLVGLLIVKLCGPASWAAAVDRLAPAADWRSRHLLFSSIFGIHHHRIGHVSPLLEPRATRQQGADANRHNQEIP
jgi:HPP family protein